MLEIHCIKNARNYKSIFDLSWTIDQTYLILIHLSERRTKYPEISYQGLIHRRLIPKNYHKYIKPEIMSNAKSNALLVKSMLQILSYLFLTLNSNLTSSQGIFISLKYCLNFCHTFAFSTGIFIFCIWCKIQCCFYTR